MEGRDGLTVFVAPRHLPSLQAIADKFGRSPRTIRAWYRAGAPIAFDGARYSAEYNSLQAWCVTNSPRP